MTTAEIQLTEQTASDTASRFMQTLLIAAIAASGLSMVFSIGTAVASASDQPAASIATSE